MLNSISYIRYLTVPYAAGPYIPLIRHAVFCSAKNAILAVNSRQNSLLFRTLNAIFSHKNKFNRAFL